MLRNIATLRACTILKVGIGVAAVVIPLVAVGGGGVDDLTGKNLTQATFFLTQCCTILFFSVFWVKNTFLPPYVI